MRLLQRPSSVGIRKALKTYGIKATVKQFPQNVHVVVQNKHGEENLRAFLKFCDEFCLVTIIGKTPVLRGEFNPDPNRWYERTLYIDAERVAAEAVE